MGDKTNGCFAWLIRVKRSCNERWAKFRNNFRRRFYRSNPHVQFDPSTLDNETGTSDMVISKISTNGLSPSPVRLISLNADQNEEYDVCPQDNAILDMFVSEVISNAKKALEAEMGETGIINEEAATDNISMTSSIISQIANTAVVESLTNIIDDINQSAVATDKPKTLSEFMSTYGVVLNSTYESDGLPTVSD